MGNYGGDDRYHCEVNCRGNYIKMDYMSFSREKRKNVLYINLYIFASGRTFSAQEKRIIVQKCWKKQNMRYYTNFMRLSG